MYDTIRAMKAQEDYCNSKGVPNFSPGFNGCCECCHNNIYQPSGRSNGITVEEAGKRMITGCPHCHYSFVE